MGARREIYVDGHRLALPVGKAHEKAKRRFSTTGRSVINSRICPAGARRQVATVDVMMLPFRRRALGENAQTNGGAAPEVAELITSTAS